MRQAIGVKVREEHLDRGVIVRRITTPGGELQGLLEDVRMGVHARHAAAGSRYGLAGGRPCSEQGGGRQDALAEASP